MIIDARYGAVLGLAILSAAGCEPRSQTAKSDLAAIAQAEPTLAQRTPLSKAEAARAARAGILPAMARSVLPQGAMSHGDYAWDETGIEEGQLTVWVDVRRQTVSVFRNGHEIGTAVILYGAPGYDTPLGTYPILRKVADYHSRTYDAPMPYSLFLTDDGVALHASKVDNRAATHGCIGLPEAFAQKLFNVANEGDEVTVVRSGELPDTAEPLALNPQS